MPLIWGKRKAEYFFRQDWTTQISLIRLANFDFTRKWFGQSFRGDASASNYDGLPGNLTMRLRI